jgi:glycosyltransferase involved in cell wall biosynthesis
MARTNDAPLVAITTPVYNGERYLDETMACVQAQTYSNLVHFVVDNASTDRSSEIIDSFKGGRVPVHSVRTVSCLPMTDSWNVAIRLIPEDAQYFRLLPADDLMDVRYVEKLVALGAKYPHVNTFGCQEWVGDKLRGNDLPANQEVFDGRAIVRGWLRWEIHGFPVLHCLYRKPVGGLSDPFYGSRCHGSHIISIDTEAAMRAMTAGPGAFIHEGLVTTRLHRQSVTSTVVTPNGLNLWSQLQLIDRWGPLAFDNEAEFLACRRQHLRYYWRNYLMWQARRQEALVEKHRDLLRRANALPTAADYVAAIAGWPVLRATRSWKALSSEYQRVSR